MAAIELRLTQFTERESLHLRHSPKSRTTTNKSNRPEDEGYAASRKKSHHILKEMKRKLQKNKHINNVLSVAFIKRST
jgi:hypothetical protein